MTPNESTIAPAATPRVRQVSRAQELQNRHDENRAAYRDAATAGDTAAMRKLREEYAVIKGEIADHEAAVAAENEIHREIERAQQTREFQQRQRDAYDEVKKWLAAQEDAFSNFMVTAIQLVAAHRQLHVARDNAIQGARAFKDARVFADRVASVFTLEHYMRIAASGRLSSSELTAADYLRYFEQWFSAHLGSTVMLLGEMQQSNAAALRIIEAQLPADVDAQPTPPEAA